MKHIVLHSGWQTCNIGDIGHTPGTLRRLEEELPEASITVLLHRWNADVLQMLRRRFPRVTFLPSSIGEEHDDWAEVFETCDLVIQNSGMHYNHVYGYGYDPTVLRRCVAAQKPFGLYGHSFDGFHADRGEEMPDLLRQAEFIYCRDSLSLAYLRDYGLAPKILDWGPDGCFGIDVIDDVKAIAFLAEAGLEEGEFLSVTMRTNTPSLEGGTGNLLNPRVPTPRQIAENERWADSLRQVICGWVAATGKKVLLSPEVDKEIAMARRLLLEQLPGEVQSHVVLRDHFWNVDEAASVYARAAAVVSMEPHSCIVALANGTPAIHYFSPNHGRKAHMFADIGLADWLHNIHEVPPQAIVKILKEIASDRAGAAERVAEAMNVVHAGAAKMGRTIRGVLNLESRSLPESRRLSAV